MKYRYLAYSVNGVFNPNEMSEAFNRINAEMDKKKLSDESECLKLTAIQTIDNYDGFFLSEENEYTVASDQCLLAEKNVEVGNKCLDASDPSEMDEKSNWPNTEADNRKLTEDIERLKSANEDLSQILLKEDFQMDELLDLNIGVHGNFDDFSYEHSMQSQTFNSGDLLAGGSWMSTETDNKTLTQDIERLKLAASHSTLVQILLNEENDNDTISDRGSSVHGSIKDDVYSQGLGGDQYNVCKEVTSPMTMLSEVNGDEFCLALCQHYQSVLKKLYQDTYLALENNLKSQKNPDGGQEGKQVEAAGSKSKRLATYSKPFFKSSKGLFPPAANEDVAIKRANKELQPFIYHSKQWSEAETDTLKKAIESDRLQAKLRPLMNKKELEHAKLANAKKGSEEETKIKESLALIERNIIETRSLSDITSVYGHLDDTDSIDWLKISNIDFSGQRSAQACRLFWKNAAHPALNREKWTRAEDSALVELVAIYNGTNWQEIAARLGTNRTAFMCLQRYQTKLNPCLQTGKWMADEDEFLLEVVNNSRVGENISWATVAYYVEGRSQEQCEHRWKLLHHMNQKKGRWTAEEDEKLKEAVMLFGTSKWYKLNSFVPGRTSAQCRERWKNTLDGTLQFGNWTYEEDKKLWLLVKEIGPGQWQKLANEYLPGRTDNMCLQRYKRLHEWETTTSIEHTGNKENSHLPLRGLEPEEVEKIKADQAQGIFVPRPATMTLDPCMWKKYKITRNIMGHHHRRWWSSKQKHLENRRRTDRRRKAAINLVIPGMKQQERQAIAQQLTPKLTGGQLQQHPIATGHQLPQSSQPSEDDGQLLRSGKRGRHRIPAEDVDVEEKIAALLRLHKTKQISSGNHSANDDDDEATDGRRVINRETESKVTRIVSAAMNFKKLPISHRFVALPGYYLSQSQSEGCTTGTELNDGGSPTYGLYNASLPLDAGGRRSIQGQLAQKVYVMPALPPTCATMNAFKCLQQNRAKLLEYAGKFIVPGITPDAAQKEIQKIKNVKSEGDKVVHENDSVNANFDSQFSAETEESIEMDLNGNCKVETPADGSNGSLKPGVQKSNRRGHKILCEQIVKTRRMSREVLHRAHASHDYRLLRARFTSLFTWPALLSSVHVTDPLPLQSFTQICSTEEDGVTENEFDFDGFEFSSDSDSNWKSLYKPRKRQFKRWKSKSWRQKNNKEDCEKGMRDFARMIDKWASSMDHESGYKKRVEKKRKRDEQSTSETVQRRASTRIAELVKTERQKQIQMSVMSDAMNCNETNFVEEDEFLPRPEKRFKVA